MGYRPRPGPPPRKRDAFGLTPHMHFEERKEPGGRPAWVKSEPNAAQTFLPDVWEATRDVVAHRTKAAVAATVGSVGIVAANGGAPDTIVGIFMCAMLVVLYGMIGHAYVQNRRTATPPREDPTGFMGYADAAPSIEDDLSATARKIATPCKCGSEAPAVPVDVEFDESHTIAVAHLCPECREPRTAKQLRVEAERHRRVEQSVARALQARQGVDFDGPQSYERDAAVAAYRQVLAEFDAVIGELTIEHDGHGSVIMSQAQVDRIDTLSSKVMEAKRAVERAAPAPEPWQAVSAAPAAGTIIEQGEWVYEIPWHAEDDLCAEDDHEWESIMTHASTTPLRTLCVRCGARRWRSTESVFERNRRAFMEHPLPKFRALYVASLTKRPEDPDQPSTGTVQ